MNYTNKKVRIAMVKNNLKQHQAAKLLGMHDSVLSRKLRYELPEEEQDKMVEMINRLSQKTLSEEVEEIKADICNHYCKYPDIWDEEAEGMELIDSEHCQNCPLNRL